MERVKALKTNYQLQLHRKKEFQWSFFYFFRVDSSRLTHDFIPCTWKQSRRNYEISPLSNFSIRGASHGIEDRMKAVRRQISTPSVLWEACPWLVRVKTQGSTFIQLKLVWDCPNYTKERALPAHTEGDLVRRRRTTLPRLKADMKKIFFLKKKKVK